MSFKMEEQYNNLRGYERVLSPEQVKMLREKLGEAAQSVLEFIAGDEAPKGFNHIEAVRYE